MRVIVKLQIGKGFALSALSPQAFCKGRGALLEKHLLPLIKPSLDEFQVHRTNLIPVHHLKATQNGYLFC